MQMFSVETALQQALFHLGDCYILSPVSAPVPVHAHAIRAFIRCTQALIVLYMSTKFGSLSTVLHAAVMP